jgi:hypothetical protein
MSNENIQALIDNFARQLVAATEAAAAQRIQAALAGAFGAPQKRGPGRPKQAVAAVAKPAKKSRPKQLCPVPGCKNPAAPVFGMVCAKHKDLPKGKIKKFREDRKAKAGKAEKTAAPKAAPAKKAAKASPKLARARKLQGQYLGALKSLTEADKAKVKAVAKDKGVADALKLAVTLKKPSK